MCTDEQWTQRTPQRVMMLSKFWKFVSGKPVEKFNTRSRSSFWLTPLDVPKDVEDYFLSFPQYSETCATHVPFKLY